jgi:protein TonB
MRPALPPASPLSRIDSKRIAANSLAVLVHVLAFAVLMLPRTWTPPTRPAPPPLVVMPEIVTPKPPVPMPPPDPQPERPRTPTPAATPAAVATPAAEGPAVLDTGTQAAPPQNEGTPADTYTPGPPGLATLAYDVHPAPRYPRSAMRAGQSGTVVLKVLVDEQGWPRQVEVETSSGHRELDRAAREQVLSAWRFHPATDQGRPVSAYALVPIAFSLP